MFELSQLRCFVAAAEELHFGRAAARLNMTQPPLSRQIQLLEHSLNVTLLSRSSRSVRLTPAGRNFLAEARRILRLAESAAISTRRVASGEAGSIAIGFTAASGYGFLPRFLSAARRDFPDVDLVLKEMVTGDQIEALLTGTIDLGLLRPPIDRRKFEAVRILTEPLVAALPADDELAAKPALQLADLDQTDLIMYTPEGARYFHDLLIGLFNRGSVAPHYVHYMNQIHSMLALVRAGLGAALVPEAATSLNFTGVTFRPVATEPERPVELYLTWRIGNDNPVLPLFVALCKMA